MAGFLIGFIPTDLLVFCSYVPRLAFKYGNVFQHQVLVEFNVPFVCFALNLPYDAGRPAASMPPLQCAMRVAQ